MNHRAPRVQSMWRSFTRKLATIMRTRLCIQPSACSWRIPASTIGYPVLPGAPGLEALVGLLPRVDPHLPHRRVERAGAPCRGGGGARRRRTPASTARWRRPARPCPARGGSGSAAGAGSPTSGTATAATCCRGPGGRARRRSRARVRRGTRRGAGGPPAPPASGSSASVLGGSGRRIGGDAGGPRDAPWSSHRGVPAVGPPRPRERREHLEVVAALVHDLARGHRVGRTDAVQLAAVLLEGSLHVLVARRRRTDRSPPRSRRGRPRPRGPVPGPWWPAARCGSRVARRWRRAARAGTRTGTRAGWDRPACAAGCRARRAARPRPRLAAPRPARGCRPGGGRAGTTSPRPSSPEPTQAACQSVTACASSTSRENGAPVTARPKLPPLPSDAVQLTCQMTNTDARSGFSDASTNVKVQSLVASRA